jgi:hypothetical protein
MEICAQRSVGILPGILPALPFCSKSPLPNSSFLLLTFKLARSEADRARAAFRQLHPLRSIHAQRARRQNAHKHIPKN